MCPGMRLRCDLATLAWFIFFQMERADKHERRAHRKQPIRVHIGENCGLGLKQSVQAAQCLLLSGMRAQADTSQAHREGRESVVKSAGTRIVRQDGLMILAAPSYERSDGGCPNALADVAHKIHESSGSVSFFR